MTGFLKRREYGETSSGVSRRRFLKIAATGVGGAALLAPGAGGAASVLAGQSKAQVGLDELNRSAFSQHLGEGFKIRSGPLEQVDVKLVEISDILSSPSPSGEESFSAVFRGPPNSPLEQNTYMIEHP